jgi:hypothetical protein
MVLHPSILSSGLWNRRIFFSLSPKHSTLQYKYPFIYIRAFRTSESESESESDEMAGSKKL